MFPAESTPDTIGAYKVVHRLPGVGRAEVFLARSQGPMGFARECELKLLPDTSEGSAAFAEELAREAAICAKLNHPAVVRVIDFFEHDGKLVLALEHVDGTTLEQLLVYLAEKHKRLGDAAAFYIGQRLAGALADAHAATDADGKPTPIVHRNLTPENVLVSVDGEVRLTGFGVGKILGRTPDSAVGTITGTPGFMAPEQARGEPVTTKADVYGIGLLLWSLLSGRRPPADGTWPRRISGLRPDLSREVAALVEAALDHFPGTRKVSAREMEQWLTKSAPTGRGKAELKDRVAALRAEPEFVEVEEAPLERPSLPVPTSPYQGVRFGPPPAAREPEPAAEAKPPAEPKKPFDVRKPFEAKKPVEPNKPRRPTRTATITGLSREVLNLPPPPPAAVPPPSAAPAASPPAAPAPMPAEVTRPSVQLVPPPAKPAPPRPTPVPPAPQASPEPPPVSQTAVSRAPAPVALPPPPPPASSNDWPGGRGSTIRMLPSPVSVRTPSPLAPGVVPNGSAVGPMSSRDPAPPIANGAPPQAAAFTPPPPSVQFGPPPSTHAPPVAVPADLPPAPPSVQAAPRAMPVDLPPPRAPLPSLFISKSGKRALSAMGAIVVSAVTATVVVTVAFYVFLHRQPAPVPAVGAAASASASVVAPPAPSAAPTGAPATSAAASANPADLPYGFGYLTVSSPAVATVYVSGKLAGPVNEPLKVRCGRFFVRLATPRSTHYPEWVSAGETVVVACQGSTRIELGPAAP